MREAVPDIIALQAVTEALGEVDELTLEGERALALDRAELQIRTHGGNLHALWKDAPLHPGLAELIHDARRALADAKSAGLEWSVHAESLVASHPAGLIEEFTAAGFRGTLFVPTPGVPLFAGCPAVFLWSPGGDIPSREMLSVIESSDLAESLGAEATRGPMRQVYRQFDFAKGRAVRDLVVPMAGGLPGGQPLLVCAIERGVVQPVTLPPRKSAPQEPLPLEFADRVQD